MAMTHSSKNQFFRVHSRDATMAARTDLTTEKFGTPLYGAAFLSETLLAVGGGGGHGLKNK